MDSFEKEILFETAYDQLEKAQGYSKRCFKKAAATSRYEAFESIIKELNAWNDYLKYREKREAKLSMWNEYLHEYRENQDSESDIWADYMK